MHERLTPEEIERYRRREAIARDDPEAICTAAGWKAWKAYREASPSLIFFDEMSIPNVRFWRAELKDAEDHEGHIDIECERWFDARTFARTLAGAREVNLIELEAAPAGSRWQVRWEGSALDPRNPPTLVARRNAETEFRPIRDR